MRLTSGRLLLGLAVGAVGLSVAARRTARATDRLVDDLHASAGTPPSYSTTEDLDGLPAPVRRYLEQALPEGGEAGEDGPAIRTARLEQRGELRLGDDWRPFTATQHVAVDPPGFVWEADVAMAPLVDATVVDAYVDGEGSLRATVFGVPVADVGSSPEMDEGELMRYLAEAVWYPTALLPGAGVEWEELDEERARVTLTDGDTTASLSFTFGQGGLVRRVHGRRYRQEEDDHALWVGYFSGYERRDGFLVPTEGEVEWQLPDRDVPYWRGTVSDAEYDTGS